MKVNITVTMPQLASMFATVELDEETYGDLSSPESEDAIAEYVAQWVEDNVRHSWKRAD